MMPQGAEVIERTLPTGPASGARHEFLTHVSARLTSLDFDQNLAAVVDLIVPTLADGCWIDLLDAGELQRVAIAPADPATLALSRELERRFPPRRDVAGGMWEVLTTGEPVLLSNVDDQTLQRFARNAEHLELLRRLGVHSAMLLPLRRRQDVFGVLSTVLTGRRHYHDDDLAFAMEVAQRASYAIDNARLYRQAQEANRAKDEFLAALSHELRTPLNAILGWVSILRARPDGEIARGLEVIYRSALAQSQLVEDLLDASRLGSERMSIDLKDTPLRPIVDAAIETILPQAFDKAIEVDRQLPDDHVIIRGDTTRLQQVFWNLLSNAVKFTPRGGRLTITSTRSTAEIAVHVTDTGAGIAPESLPHIFDRFSHADATTTRRFRGLGLGLTLTRQLTEMHGGQVTAVSPGVGSGSTFTVALPLVDRQPLPRGASAADAPQHALAGLRILAVDDEPDSLEKLLSLLRIEKASAFGADSASEALRLLQKERPQLVISDIAMPDHDGYWLMEQINRLTAEGGPSVPCVALTAFANQTARERALATGFFAHHSKPFDPDRLIQTILSAVGHQIQV